MKFIYSENVSRKNRKTKVEHLNAETAEEQPTTEDVPEIQSQVETKTGTRTTITSVHRVRCDVAHGAYCLVVAVSIEEPPSLL